MLEHTAMVLIASQRKNRKSKRTTIVTLDDSIVTLDDSIVFVDEFKQESAENVKDEHLADTSTDSHFSCQGPPDLDRRLVDLYSTPGPSNSKLTLLSLHSTVRNIVQPNEFDDSFTFEVAVFSQTESSNGKLK